MKSLIIVFVVTVRTESPGFVLALSQTAGSVFPEKLSATKASLVQQGLLCTSCVLYISSLGRMKCKICYFLVTIEVPVLFKVQTLEKETNRQ